MEVPTLKHWNEMHVEAVESLIEEIYISRLDKHLSRMLYVSSSGIGRWIWSFFFFFF